jgi:2-polyprenyl-3-methyl-5-hydroxy-6-metoxy-1,4-benzoquinol methylase
METLAPNSIDYAVKPKAYYANCRPEMLAYIPSRARQVLDVGCGTGEFGAAIKEVRQATVWGVEPFASAAEQAATKIDKAIHGVFPPEEPLPAGRFDCIVFNDVLEHMLDPEQALRAARPLLARDGVIVASIPNIRHFPTAWRLIVQGDWTYQDSGTLDKTHLRFFTRSSIERLFASAGYEVEIIEGINSYCAVPSVKWRMWRLYRWANLLSLGHFSDLKYLQFAIVARPTRAA